MLLGVGCIVALWRSDLLVLGCCLGCLWAC